MDDLDLLTRFGVAIGIGLLVGVERHWPDREELAGRRTAGIRTHALVGLLGGAAGVLGQTASAGAATGLILGATFLGFTAAFAAFAWREAAAEESFSVTGVIAAQVTFALAALAGVGEPRIAAAAGVAAAGLLAAREVLHEFMRRLTWPELRSALVLLGMTVTVLPFVPDTPIGPFGGISPAKVWSLVVLLAGLSFAGYVAVRLFGEDRGELLAGALGGMVSSTAVAVDCARRSRDGQPAPILAAAASIAGAVSLARTAVLAAVLAPVLGPRLGPPLAAAALVLVLGAFWMARGGNGAPHPAPRNPLALRAVFLMAALLVGVGFVARAAAAWAGPVGLLVVSALTGLADVDAATVTAAGLAGGAVPAGTAALSIGLAAGSNVIAKAAYGAMLGTPGFALRFGAVSAAAIAAAGAVALLLPAEGSAS